MAKYKVEYENNEIKHTLVFRNKEFTYTTKETEFFTKSDESLFSVQLSKEFNDLDEDILNNEVDIDTLHCFIEEGVFNIIKKLEELE